MKSLQAVTLTLCALTLLLVCIVRRAALSQNRRILDIALLVACFLLLNMGRVPVYERFGMLYATLFLIVLALLHSLLHKVKNMQDVVSYMIIFFSCVHIMHSGLLSMHPTTPAHLLFIPILGLFANLAKQRTAKLPLHNTVICLSAIGMCLDTMLKQDDEYASRKDVVVLVCYTAVTFMILPPLAIVPFVAHVMTEHKRNMERFDLDFDMNFEDFNMMDDLHEYQDYMTADCRDQLDNGDGRECVSACMRIDEGVPEIDIVRDVSTLRKHTVNLKKAEDILSKRTDKGRERYNYKRINDLDAVELCVRIHKQVLVEKKSKCHICYSVACGDKTHCNDYTGVDYKRCMEQKDKENRGLLKCDRITNLIGWPTGNDYECSDVAAVDFSCLYEKSKRLAAQISRINAQWTNAHR